MLPTKKCFELALFYRLNLSTKRNFITAEGDTFSSENVFFQRAYAAKKSEKSESSDNESASYKSHSGSSKKYDIAIIGGGIVGTASAREIMSRHKKKKMIILEKENKLAVHQTGHNSGVLHCGIYYTPGSLRAKLCVEGIRLMYAYCDEKKIPYKKCGKLIVATTPLELERLKNLYDRGIKNQVPDMKIYCQDEIKKIEPHVEGLGAIFSPMTGIVDYAKVTNEMAKDFDSCGGEIKLNFNVKSFEDSKDPYYPIKIISTTKEEVLAKHVLCCAGLFSDRLAVKSGCSKNPQIIPFRGEYLILNPDKRHLVKANIYPVPDPSLPFLGVHCTPRMDGNIWLGPNAVIAFKREGYRWLDFNLRDTFEIFTNFGFIKLSLKNFRFGIMEIARSLIIPLQVCNLNKFLPDLTEYDVQAGPAGVRAQALDASGNLVDDFVFDRADTKPFNRILHCRNAPSPGATSSMAIAKVIADKIDDQIHRAEKEEEKMKRKDDDSVC